MKDVSCDGWQIIQTGRGSVTVVILHPEYGLNEADFKQRISNELDKQGSIAPSIDLEYPSSLYRTALGKVALVKALAPTQYLKEVNAT